MNLLKTMIICTHLASAAISLVASAMYFGAGHRWDGLWWSLMAQTWIATLWLRHRKNCWD